MNSEPIRILHVIGSMNRGGAEAMIMNLYRQIDRARVSRPTMRAHVSGIFRVYFALILVRAPDGPAFPDPSVRISYLQYDIITTTIRCQAFFPIFLKKRASTFQ